MVSYTAITEFEIFFESMITWGQEPSSAEAFFSEIKSDNFDRAFWSTFNLLELISIASTSKTAWYMTYYNSSDFAKFCLKVWKEKILDLSNMEFKNTKDLTFIINLFSGLYNEIIFPRKISPGILESVPYGIKKMTFYLSDEFPIMRHSFQQYMRTPMDITLIEESKISANLRSPALDIIFSFPNINKLVLKGITFDTPFIAALKTIRVKSLTISRPVLPYYNRKSLTNALLERKNTLKELTLISKNIDDALHFVIREITENLNCFTSLTKFKASMYLDNKKAKFLKRRIPSSLKNLTIFTSNFFPKNKLIEMLGKNRNIVLKRFISEEVLLDSSTDSWDLFY